MVGKIIAHILSFFKLFEIAYFGRSLGGAVVSEPESLKKVLGSKAFRIFLQFWTFSTIKDFSDH